MKNIKLTVEYDGTDYNGWQAQKNKTKSVKNKINTIQQEIEAAIKKITNEKVILYASGRTDSGVHAKAQVANFHTKTQISPVKLNKALNAVLPKDISILKAEEADKEFHSRYNSKRKTYRYAILNRKSRSVFISKYTLHIPYKLNIGLMKKECACLLGRQDYTSFCAGAKKSLKNTRTIYKIKIKKNKDSLIFIDIEGDGFLYNMVRNIAGTLIEIGRGKLAQGSLKKILKAKDRKAAGPTAPAHGLCLMKVEY